eukprot:CAMPEP_0119053138 /NCGR_PEP_ID=MMETSP1177-20130426/74186_1 /TAXON_ID=2985 /ORGANISM="Ochromonas sp, Strain CCMP1899" /LENGTH=292 /DNA_ID=CAMNT_0007032983 /DNA_START=1960 /DNA_END=2838 /DNA_ORIENTATION=-
MDSRKSIFKCSFLFIAAVVISVSNGFHQSNHIIKVQNEIPKVRNYQRQMFMTTDIPELISPKLMFSHHLFRSTDSNVGVKAVADVTVGTTLMVFVVDTSMPGGGRRIAAVQGAISSLLPKTRVAIVSCFGNEAEVTLGPTSSVITATGKFHKMTKSVMGNLGAGLELALKTSEDALSNKYADRVVMAILADGKAHGLLTGTSDCEIEVVDLCDLELMTSASAIQLKTKELNADGLRLSSVIVDTVSKKPGGAEWLKEGARLASVTGSDYYHSPTLTDTELLRILSDVKTRNV